MPQPAEQDLTELIALGVDPALLMDSLQLSLADENGHILYVNQAFCRASGYTREELLGQPYRLIASNRQPPAFFTAMWNQLRAGAAWHGELSNRNRDGGEYWIELTILPVAAAAAPPAPAAAPPDKDLPGGALPHRFLGIGKDISRVVSAERQARRSAERFQGLAETVGAAIMLHRGGKLLYVNRALERCTGYRREELLECAFFDLVREDQRETLRQRSAAMLRGEGEAEAEMHEVPILTRGGDLRWLDVTVVRIAYETGHALLATALDVTGRKQAEAAQQHIQQVLQQIVQGSPVPTFVIDSAGVVTHWNHACELVTDTPASQMLGRGAAWEAFYDYERPVLAELIVTGDIERRIDSYYHGNVRRSPIIPGAYEAELFFPRSGDNGRWLFFTAAPLRDLDGRIIGAIETLVDMSERKQAEEALRRARAELESKVEQRTAQLASAKAELEADVSRRAASEQEALRRNAALTELNARLQDAQQQLLQSEKLASIGQLAAGVAHEINNPIGYVQSNLGTLERYLADLGAVATALASAAAQLPPEHPAAIAARQAREAHDYDFIMEDLPALLQQSREGVDRVRKIVADLKDFSRVDSGQDWQWSDLHAGLDSTLNIVNNEIKYRAEVVKEYARLPEVECLPSQLNQVFLNLLVNAAHAIPDGRLGRILIRTGHDAAAGKVWVEVSDDGVGIPGELMKRIFDPFFTTKPIGKGTGLGLSLAYGIVKKHGGELQVESEPGQGSRFRVVLPVQRSGGAPGEA